MFASLITVLLAAGATGLLSGRVEDRLSGAPILGASLTIVGSSLGAATADNGTFVLGPLAPGRYRLVASHIAYEPETTLVEVFADYTSRPVLSLTPIVIPMPEVRARSARRETEEKLTVREIPAQRLERQAGGFVQDPIRSLSFLPGVAASSRGEWSGAYVVRGGDPDESSVWLGDLELLWPYHLLGFSSVINPDIVGKISFYPSVLPTEYGGVLSSIAMMRPKEQEQNEGFWAYDPLNLKAAYVGNLADIGFLGSVRRTYYNVLFGPIGGGTYNRPSYSDFTGQVSLPLGQSSRLRATAVQGSDHITSTLRGIPTEMTESGFSLGTTIESRLGKGTSLATLFSNTHDFVLTPAVWWGTAVTRQHEYGVRVGVTMPVRPHMTTAFGGELSRQTYRGNLMKPTVLLRSDNGYAFYGSLGFQPLPLARFDFGLRYENVRWAEDQVLSPRAVLSVFVRDGITLRAGYRRHFQHSYSFLRSSCAAFVFDREYESYQLFENGLLGAKRADHYSLGSELRLFERTRLTVDVYLKEYDQLPTWRASDQGRIDGVGNAGRGFARGMELTLEQGPVNGWSGWLSHTLAATRKQQGTDTMLYWDRNDRRHLFGLSVEKDLGRGWTLSGTFNLNSGVPYTPLLYTQSPQERVGSADLNRGTSRHVIVGEKNSARVPLYHRLDLKLRRDLPKLPLRPHIYLEILNVYNRQNAYYLVQFEDRDGRIITGQSTGIPFIPLFGIGGRF